MAFSTSYSKIKNYETCPKRYYEIDIAKHFKEDSEALRWGNTLHKALANACSGKVPLPEELKDYQSWIDKVKAGPGELLVEQQFAITKDFQPCEWFGPRAWFRGICDVLRINGSVAMALDWKTGKIQHDSIQLMLMAQCIFTFHPEVKRIGTAFVWLKDNCTTPETFSRDTIRDQWIGVLERIKVLEEASRTMTFEPKPGRLCANWCPVISCPYHGKRHS